MKAGHACVPSDAEPWTLSLRYSHDSLVKRCILSHSPTTVGLLTRPLLCCIDDILLRAVCFINQLVLINGLYERFSNMLNFLNRGHCLQDDNLLKEDLKTNYHVHPNIYLINYSSSLFEFSLGLHFHATSKGRKKSLNNKNIDKMRLILTCIKSDKMACATASIYCCKALSLLGRLLNKGFASLKKHGRRRKQVHAAKKGVSNWAC